MNPEVSTREVFWNISSLGETLFIALAILATGVCFYGIYIQGRRILQGKPSQLQLGDITRLVLTSFNTAINNRRIFKQDDKAGMMHGFIVAGFITLFIGTVIVALEYDLFQKLFGLEHGFWQGWFFLGFELTLDVMGALFILGLSYMLYRRYILLRPQLRWTKIDLLMPVWLLVIAITGFVIEGLRLAAMRDTLVYNPLWSPVGFVISKLTGGGSPETLQSVHWFLWWFHAFISLGWVASLPYTPKVAHVVAAGINLLVKDVRPRGRLNQVDVEAAFENEDTLGFAKISDMSRLDLLDLVSCTECGRCEMNCPAHHSGKKLSPRSIILQLRDQVNEELPFYKKTEEGFFQMVKQSEAIQTAKQTLKDPEKRKQALQTSIDTLKSPSQWKGLVKQQASRELSFFKAPDDQKEIMKTSITPEEIWACTSCMACVEACPVYIDPLDKILQLRRHEVMDEDQYPETYGGVFTGIERRQNPWNEHPSTRLNWAKGLDVKVMSELEEGEQVDYLFWVGCSAAFDARNQKIAQSVVKLLNAAGVSFGVLGTEETCSGDPARRIGHEYIYQMQAEANVETMEQYAFKKVLTLCPHCFNTLDKEYPDFGGNYEVVHHTVLIKELLTQGKIKFTKPLEGTIAYHDSCYLGRHNRIFEPPREILQQLSGIELVEMERNRETGMCCGAGGGLMWIEEDQDKRVNDNRIAQAEAVLPKDSKKPATIASACPFCMTMLEDGLAAKKSKLQDKDIAELVVEAMGI